MKKKQYPSEKWAWDVRSFIVRFKAANRYMPSVAEVAKEFGKSKGWAHSTLRKLAEMGAVKVHAGKHRGIVLVPDWLSKVKVKGKK